MRGSRGVLRSSHSPGPTPRAVDHTWHENRENVVHGEAILQAENLHSDCVAARLLHQYLTHTPQICIFRLDMCFFGWTMLGSNQRPLPCEGSVIDCWRFLEIAKCLQMDVFSLRGFSQHFRIFTRVAARLLHAGGPTPAARHGSSLAVRERRRCTHSSARIGRVTSRQLHRTRSRTGLNRHPRADSLTQRRGRVVFSEVHSKTRRYSLVTFSCFVGGDVR